MNYTINTILGINTTKKDGTPLITKTGKPYKRASVKFAEDPEKIVTLMVWDGDPDPVVGGTLEGSIESREYNGNTYYDFKGTPKSAVGKKAAELEFSLKNLQRKQDQIIAFLKEKFPPEGAGLTSAGTKVPDFVPSTPEQAAEFEQKMDAYENKSEDVTPEDIPF